MVSEQIRDFRRRVSDGTDCERLTEPAAAVSATVADIALRAREEAFSKKRRAPQRVLRARVLRFVLSPRVVMRDVLVNDHRRFVLLISALAASAIVATASAEERTLSGLFSVCLALPLALLFGVSCVYARSPISGNVCRWLGGDVTIAETRTLLAWAWLPMALVGVLLLPRTLAVIAVHMESTPGLFPTLAARANQVLLFYDGLRDALIVVALVAVLWAFMLETVLLADAADISKPRAFIASCASSLIPFTALAALLALSSAL